MSKREIVEDSLLAVTIVCLFSLIFSFTYAFQNEIQQSASVQSVTLPPIEKVAKVEQTISVPTAQTAITATSTDIVAEATTTLESTPEIIDVVFVKKITPVADTASKPDKKVSAPVVPHIATPSTPSVQSINESDYMQSLASLLEQQTNAFRKNNNLPNLLADSVLKQSGEKYSKLMLRENFFSHTDNNGCDMTCRFKNNGYKANTWGENLAKMSFDDLPPVEEVADFFMDGWEKSAGHRENLLSDAFTHQGIGIAMDSGNIYVTVDFAKPLQ